MLNKRAIATLRGVADRALPDVADVYSPPDPNTAARDANGEVDMSFPSGWTKVGNALPCRVSLIRSRGNESTGPDVTQATTGNTIAFAWNTVVDAKDRIIITASANQSQLVGQVFDVTDAPMVSNQVSRVVVVEQRQ